MKKERRRHDVSLCLRELEADDIYITRPGLNPEAFKEFLNDALAHLRDYQDMADAAEVADMGLAEVGAIIRRQRETIAFLRHENKSMERRERLLEDRIDRLTDRLEKMEGVA